MRAVRARLERIPIAWGRWTLPYLPRSAVLRLAHLLGRIAYCLDRRGRRIAAANLEVVYGSRLSESRRRRLLVGSYCHMSQVLLDLFWFGRQTRTRLLAWCTVPADAAAVLTAGPGILAGGHLGNWEVAGQALVARGVPLTSVAKRIGSEGTTSALNTLRRSIGQRIALADGAVRVLMSALRSGGTIAILQDQHTDPDKGGVWVDFLGLPAAVSSAAARLAIKTAMPIHVAFCLAQSRGRYLFRILHTFDPHPYGQDAVKLTQDVTSVLCRQIRRHPSQWLIMYKRWKRIPPSANAAAYPFYARPWPDQA